MGRQCELPPARTSDGQGQVQPNHSVCLLVLGTTTSIKLTLILTLTLSKSCAANESSRSGDSATVWCLSLIEKQEKANSQ